MTRRLSYRCRQQAWLSTTTTTASDSVHCISTWCHSICQHTNEWTCILRSITAVFDLSAPDCLNLCNSGRDVLAVSRAVDAGVARVQRFSYDWNAVEQSRNEKGTFTQWHSQKFSTSVASICSIPFCPFPFSSPTKSAVWSKNVMTYHTAWMIKRTMHRPITLRNHIPKNYVFPWQGVRTPLTPLVWLCHCFHNSARRAVAACLM